MEIPQNVAVVLAAIWATVAMLYLLLLGNVNAGM
jgi:hypothetical protein